MKVSQKLEKIAAIARKLEAHADRQQAIAKVSYKIVERADDDDRKIDLRESQLQMLCDIADEAENVDCDIECILQDIVAVASASKRIEKMLARYLRSIGK